MLTCFSFPPPFLLSSHSIIPLSERKPKGEVKVNHQIHAPAYILSVVSAVLSVMPPVMTGKVELRLGVVFMLQ